MPRELAEGASECRCFFQSRKTQPILHILVGTDAPQFALATLGVSLQDWAHGARLHKLKCLSVGTKEHKATVVISTQSSCQTWVVVHEWEPAVRSETKKRSSLKESKMRDGPIFETAASPEFARHHARTLSGSQTVLIRFFGAIIAHYRAVGVWVLL